MNKRIDLKISDFVICSAVVKDVLDITHLYHEVYLGSYPDLLMRDVDLISKFISSNANIWVVVKYNKKIIASVLYETDLQHRLAKVFGGVVLSEYRGMNLLEHMMVYGSEQLIHKTKSIDVIYAITRTVTSAPQLVTKKLGYKMLGIFPNIHKTDIYETHALTALFHKGVLENRFSDFKIHPKIRSLFNIVKNECGFNNLSVAVEEEYTIPTLFSTNLPKLEIIDNAPEFVYNRFKELDKLDQLPIHFFPFHIPNMMIVSPDLKIEIFLFMSKTDKYCTIIDIKKQTEFNFTTILFEVSRLLREINVRYIEILARANKLRTLDNIMKANFVPCAYFPAYQLSEGERYDYVVLSKTYEIFDFQNLKFAGINELFLEQYYLRWKDIFLSPILKKVK